MPADLEIVNGQIQMMYAQNGGMPWWGEGGVVMPGDSFEFSDVREKLPLLMSDHDKIPHYMWVPNEDVQEHEQAFRTPTEGRGTFVPMPRHFDIRRRLDMKGIGPVGAKYTIIQPEQINESIAQAIFKENLKLETVGLLNDGSVGWFLARIPGDYSVRRQDGTEDVNARYVVFKAAFDGSGKLVTKITAVRVVCSNTLSFALADRRNSWGISHTKNWEDRVDELVENVRTALGYYDEVIEIEQKLENTRMNKAEASDFFAELLNLPTRAQHDAALLDGMLEQKQPTRRLNMLDELVELYENGTGNRGLTARDALNAVTEYQTHNRTIRVTAKRSETGYTADYAKYESAILDDDPMKTRALNLLIKKAA